MKLSLCFHVFNKAHWIESVVRSWLDTLSGDHETEVIAVFDDTTDDSERVVYKTMIDYPAIQYTPLTMTAGWEIRCNNAALAQAAGEWCVFIQDDNWMHTTGWDALLIDTAARHAPAGIVGLLAGGYFTRNQDIHRIECDRPHKGENFTMQGCPDAPLGVYEVDFITRPCAAPTEIAWQLNGFDEAFYPMDWDETDLSFRAHRVGLRNLYLPFDLVNVVGKRDTIKENRMRENYQRGRAIFMARHGEYIRGRSEGIHQQIEKWG